MLASLAGAPLARAQTDSHDTAKVAAEALFEEGRRLMADGKTAEACPKFAESQRLDPASSTLLNLASCYEKSDRPATAWSTYRQAASSALAANRQDLVATAQKHADALVSALPRMSLTVSAPVDGIDVKIDGVSVGRAEGGIAVPVDPGDHTIEASAPSFKPWSTKVTVAHDAATIPVVVPALEAGPRPRLPPAGDSGQSAPRPRRPPPASRRETPGRTQRMVGVVVGAAGVVGLGISAALAVVAKSEIQRLAHAVSGLGRPVHAAGGHRARGRAHRGRLRERRGRHRERVRGRGDRALARGSFAGRDTRATQAARIELVPTLGGGMVSGRW